MSENGSEIDQQTTKMDQSEVQTKIGDEQVQNMTVGEIDPAILCVRERVTIRYSREELMEIGENSISKSKPGFIDPNEVCNSILIPDKWNLETKKSSESQENNGKTNENSDNRRRSGDPRERIRKENDGIVLSPQRRSFNSGCFVPANKEPLGGKADAPPPLMGVREISNSNRRIGSGRIIRDSWDGDKDNNADGDFNNFGRGGSSSMRNNERDDKREENKYNDRRSSYGRDGEKEGGRRSRYNDNRRRYSENKEDEPEWFSSGPISQNDTIELRGFDESEKLVKTKKSTTTRVKRTKEWTKKKENVIVEDKEKDIDETVETKENKATSNTENGPKEKKNAVAASSENTSNSEQKDANKKTSSSSSSSSAQHTFDFDEFLKGENISGLLTNGEDEQTDKATSRFSRWFKKESPNKDIKATSRKSSIPEENHLFKDLLKDINEPSNSNPVSVHTSQINSNAFFAPISPAGNSLGLDERNRGGTKPVNLMEMLSKGKQPQTQQQHDGWNLKSQGSMIGGGKILCLDELESKIRQHSDHSAKPSQPKPAPKKPDEEMTAAFKKLLQQAGGNGPMSLMEMLNHSQQQDDARFAAAHATQQQQQQQQQQLFNTLHAQQSDLALKLQQAQLQQQKQQQIEMLNKFMSGNSVPAATAAAMRGVSPLLDLNAQQSRELLSRPEAQAILQGLNRGELTVQHLYQQLANPALQARHREMLTIIIKLHGNSTTNNNNNYGPSPRVLSPVPVAHHLYSHQSTAQLQQQQLRVSPLPPNAMHQRIPSPRELQVHTQNILQRALIKKKLEEQTENFRKKQEMHHGGGTSPNLGNGQNSKGFCSPTPLALFTPTSVLRKMTADKDEGKENKSGLDNGIIKPLGRALTGMRQQPQVAPQVNNLHWNQPNFAQMKAGRPIVKANTFQPQTPNQFFAQMAVQQQQQQQQQQQNQSLSQQPQRPYPSSSSSIPNNVPNNNNNSRKPIVGQYSNQNSQYGSTTQQSQFSQSNNTPQNFQQQPTLQQLRAQHQHRPTNSSTVVVPPPTQSQAQQQQQPTVPNPTPKPKSFNVLPLPQAPENAWQQFLNTASQQVDTQHSTTTSRHHHHHHHHHHHQPQSSGSLSPSTADQLTRWFSPDLLERARGGELPSTANLARLEEIERQAAAASVHN